MTWYEKIKGCSLEELAEMAIRPCEMDDTFHCASIGDDGSECVDCTMSWLKSEYKRNGVSDILMRKARVLKMLLEDAQRTENELRKLICRYNPENEDRNIVAFGVVAKVSGEVNERGEYVDSTRRVHYYPAKTGNEYIAVYYEEQ